MRVLENLEPKEVFHFFEDICRIPHPSYHEEFISQYLVDFAKERNLQYIQDDLLNVVIIKEASKGYENEDPIILQGHMDMVCEKNRDVSKDMSKEGLDLMVHDGYVWANGTTLGGDDGVAIAYALALLDSETIQHPRLEFVCTVCEEVGMDGARFIDCSSLQGKTLINLDSDVEGTVLASCAGGATAHVSLPLKREACDWHRLDVSIHGLLGGHSGVEIHKGRASSVLLMGLLLRKAYYSTGIRIISVSNGTKDNAISREGHLCVAVQNVEAFRAVVKIVEKDVHQMFKGIDPDIHISVNPSNSSEDALDMLSTCKVISLLTALPQGVQEMSNEIDGLVQTSLNWGIAETQGEEWIMRGSLRSSVSRSYDQLVEKVSWITQSYGGRIELKGVYPAWQWVSDSKLRDKMCKIYQLMFQEELTITAIHAGVECGYFADKIEGLDAVSMGPNILDIHTPNEHLDIASTQRMWNYLVKIIETKSLD